MTTQGEYWRHGKSRELEQNARFDGSAKRDEERMDAELERAGSAFLPRRSNG